MFDANIMFYAYDNAEGDDFGVGYLGNKQWWTDIVNRWGKQDGKRHDFKLDDFHDIPADSLRSCQLAEVVRDEQTFLVTWFIGQARNSVRMNHKGEFSWENNPTKNPSVPRWINRLKRAIKEHNLQ